MVEITHASGSTQLTDRAAIEQAIIQENLRKYFQTSDTPLQSQHLLQRLGPLGSSHESRQIFDGSFQAPPDATPGTKAFFSDLSLTSPAAISAFSTVPLFESFKKSWARQKERTSSYPSRHFGLLKASLFRWISHQNRHFTLNLKSSPKHHQSP